MYSQLAIIIVAISAAYSSPLLTPKTLKIKRETNETIFNSTRSILPITPAEAIEIVKNTATILAKESGTSKSGCWVSAARRGFGQRPSLCIDSEEIYSTQDHLCHPKCGKFEALFSFGDLCVGKGPTSNPICPKDEILHDSQCFETCDIGFTSLYTPLGNFCYQTKCPKEFPFSCGPALCLKNNECNHIVTDQAAKGAAALITGYSLGSFVPLVPVIVKVVTDLVSYPGCSVEGATGKVLPNPNRIIIADEFVGNLTNSVTNGNVTSLDNIVKELAFF